MEISTELAADLRTLTEALGPPGVDLEAQLRALITDIRMSNGSYLGLALTVVSGGVPFTILALDELLAAAGIRSSAKLPLPALCDVEAGSSIVFYAAEPVAFVDFARGVSIALGVEFDAIELDAHLTPPARTEALTAIAAATQANQAIGILIDRGFEPIGAQAELARLGAGLGPGPDAAALQIIRGALDG